MQWKMNPPCLDWVIFFKLINTHGTEITPGSDVVGKNVESDFFVHVVPLFGKKSLIINKLRITSGTA
jgi:hypothetical protein